MHSTVTVRVASFTRSTYLACDDIDKVSITGLEDCIYKDKVNGGEETQQGVVSISGEVDRVYKDTRDVIIVNGVGSENVSVEKAGFKDVVVWYGTQVSNGVGTRGLKRQRE